MKLGVDQHRGSNKPRKDTDSAGLFKLLVLPSEKCHIQNSTLQIKGNVSPQNVGRYCAFSKEQSKFTSSSRLLIGNI